MTENYRTIDVSFDFKGNHIKNFAIESTSTEPLNPIAGYIYHDDIRDMVKYYDGSRWVALPYLDGHYKLPVTFLDTIGSTGSMVSASDSTIPTTLLLANEIAKLIPKTDIVTSWEAVASDSKIASEKLVKVTIDNNYQTLDSKIDTNVTNIEGEISELEGDLDAQVARLDDKINTGLDSKLDRAQLKSVWSGATSDNNIPSEKLVKDTLDGKVNRSDVTEVVVADNEKIPSGMAVSLALAGKTDVTLAIPVWNAGTIYGLNSSVVAGQKLYLSLEDGNVNNDPEEDSEHQHWAEISGGSSGSTVNGKTIVFGNTTESEYELVHNLSTYDFIWSMRTTEAPREYVNARVQATDKSKVKVILTRPPGVNALTMNLIALKKATSPTVVDPVTIAEASDSWVYANDTDSPLFIQTFNENGDQIYGDISQLSTQDFDPVRTTFTSPKKGTLVVVKTPYVYQFDDVDTWIISHNLGRLVAVQCYSDTEGQITGNVVQNANATVITFSSRKSGYAVVAVPTLAVEVNGEADWIIEHNLNRMVAVQTYDSSGDQIFGNIEQNGNSVTVSFSTAKSGFMLIM